MLSRNFKPNLAEKHFPIWCSFFSAKLALNYKGKNINDGRFGLKIQVIYKNGQEDLVEPKFLDILLQIGEVQEFRRTDHWVNATADPIRSARQHKFVGEDRRLKKHQKLTFHDNDLIRCDLQT